MRPLAFVFRREFVIEVMTLLVEVAVPEIVRPVIGVPLPIVDDEYAVSPALNCVSVEVEFPVPANG